MPPPTSFVDRLAAERIADGDPVHPTILIDAQTHVWWRAGGVRQMSDRGEHFLKSLAGSRAGVVGHPVPIADMGRVMFLEDVFLGSATDIAFLNIATPPIWRGRRPIFPISISSPFTAPFRGRPNSPPRRRLQRRRTFMPNSAHWRG